MITATAARMAWNAAGTPGRGDATAGAGECLVCGQQEEATISAKKALGANFDYLTGRGQGSVKVCVPCAWTLAGKPPQTFRLWSIAVTDATVLPPSMDTAPYPSDGRLHLCNRKNMAGIRDLLIDPPADQWAVAIAQSGQKHLLAYTPVNRGGGDWVIRWEATNLAWAPARFRECLRATASLRAAGHHPESIAAGEPSVTALKGDGLAAWREHAPRITPYARSPHIDLALHFTTKENIHALTEL